MVQLLLFFALLMLIVRSSHSIYHPSCTLLAASYRGILLIEQVDGAAGFATAFYLYHVIFAKMHSLLPYVHFLPHSGKIHDHSPNVAANATFSTVGLPRVDVDKCFKDWVLPVDIIWSDLRHLSFHKSQVSLLGSGYWSNYFHPLVPAFSLDLGCELPVVRFSTRMACPGIHVCADWAVRSWYYGESSHLPVEQIKYDETWFLRKRMAASDVVSKYFKLKQPILESVNKRTREALQLVSNTSAGSLAGYITLAIHMRGSDKSDGRSKTPILAYLEYVTAFYANVPAGKALIFMATDDNRMVTNVTATWPQAITEIIYIPKVMRSDSDSATFNIFAKNRHELNSEVLEDITMLSRCDFFLHGHSAISEAAIYSNFNLHRNSVNLDFAEGKRQYSPASFGDNVAVHAEMKLALQT